MTRTAPASVMALVLLATVAACSSTPAAAPSAPASSTTVIDPSTTAATAPTLTATGTTIGATSPRPLTTDEAQRLAIMRFNNFNVGTKAISGNITDGNTQVAITGWINYVDHVGYAFADPGTSATASPFLVEWTFDEVGFQSFTGTAPPLPVPTTGWEVQPFDPSVSFLAGAQGLLLGLALDRPDNPQLLQQSSAQWIRSDTLNGVAVDVIAAPKEAEGEAVDPTDTSEATVRYWVDGQGNLMRIEMHLAAQFWSLVDFTDAPEVSIPNPNAGSESIGQTAPSS